MEPAERVTDGTIADASQGPCEAPHPGVPQMPRWDTGELIDAPRFTWRNWAAMIGPGVVAGGAAIGGGEWLVGPIVTAKYGGALMWLAALSILGQVIYNLEISRYTLYCGEPIFTGKFRLVPGPTFWLCAYLVLDFGAVFPYLASNAATPLAAMILGQIPQESNPNHLRLMHVLAYVVFLMALVPLFVGGKVYNSIRVVMSVKIVVVLGFLLILGVFYSKPSTWSEIFSGFFKFGTVPVQGPDVAPLPGPSEGSAAEVPLLKPGHTANIFISLYQGKGLPPLDLSLIAMLAAFAAIAGQGGLTNTPISNWTRDQGWGMGWQVGAIPSVIGGRNLKLSHVGAVFDVNEQTLPRWRRWYRHVLRDQLVVWMPACFLGVALPSMLSVEFLPRGVEVGNWTAAGMTADGVRDRVAAINGPMWGQLFWLMTLFCGFLVLGTSMVSTADGLVRRWVDVFWTSSKRLRKWDPKDIGRLYFTVLVCWALFGLIMLQFNPRRLIELATLIMNFALGFSCLHTLAVNLVLLPPQLRPNWFIRIGMLLTGVFFLALATAVLLSKLGFIAS